MKKGMQHLKPNKEFIRDTERVFMAAFHTQYPNSHKAPLFAFRYFIRGAASGVAFMVILGSVSVYADQTNVGPDNVLYPLKRTQESVNLLFVNAEDQAAFHLKLAERRLDEVESIKTSNPESPRIAALSKELHNEVKNSIGTIVSETEFASEDAAMIVEEEMLSAGAAPGGILSGVSSAKLSASDDRGDDGKHEDENEEEQEERKDRSAMTSAAIPLSTASSVSSTVKNATRRERTENEKEEDSEKRPEICVRWRNILQKGGVEMDKIVDDYPRFRERFEKKCP